MRRDTRIVGVGLPDSLKADRTSSDRPRSQGPGGRPA